MPTTAPVTPAIPTGKPPTRRTFAGTRATSSLQTLDTYLRAIWLECCGHLSRFSTDRWGDTEIAMRRKAAEVFAPGVTLTHEYDFGTTSYTLVKLVATRVGVPLTLRPMTLMMRNRMPEAACAKCGEPATHVCIGCVQEREGRATLCAAHAKKHRHGDWDRPSPLVNSPRLGMCGYDGPADEPYA